MKESRKHPGGRVRRPDRNCVSEREFFGARPSGRFTAPCFTAVGVVRSSDSVGTLKRHECRAPGVLLSWVADIFGGVIRFRRGGSWNDGSRGRSPHRRQRGRRHERNCANESALFGARPSGRFAAPCFTAVGVVRSSDSVGTLKRHECRAPGVLLSWVADIFGGSFGRRMAARGDARPTDWWIALEQSGG